MNSLLLFFVSGESLYDGAALLLLALVTSPYLGGRWPRLFRNIAVLFAITLIVLASPPVVWEIATVFLVAVASWFIAVDRPGRWRTAQLISALLVSVLVLAISVVELLHRSMSTLRGASNDHLVVIGDSISAGIDPRVRPWPAVFQQSTGIPVKNLARPGALAIDGPALATGLAVEDRAVLIEIGGNDLLSGVPSDEFEHGLEALAARVAAPGRTVVMFELPLLPNKVAYGRVQRRVAKKYGIALIPKRYFAAVISGIGTSDGLHLSDIGAERMASLVAKVFSPVLGQHR